MTNKYFAWALGVSIACFAFRNPIMQIGLVIGAMVCVSLLIEAGFKKQITLGSKFIYIPILIVLALIITSSVFRYFGDHNFAMMIGDVFMAVYFFAIYLVVRILGKEIFKPFALVVIVETLSLVVTNIIMHYGIRSGGLAPTGNYNIAVGILVFGAVVAIIDRQWIIVTIAAIGVFLIGAEEGIFVVAVLFVSMLIRKDISVKILAPILTVVVIAVLGIFPFGYTKTLYASAIDKADEVLFHQHYSKASTYFVYEPSLWGSTANYVTNGRINDIGKAIDWSKPFGSGYELLPKMGGEFLPIHNVPMVVIQQIGILGAVAWSFLLLYGLFKTKWKYAFIAVIALGIFDNFMFAQIGICTIALLSVVSAVEIKSDLIFRGSRGQQQSLKTA